MSNVVVSQVVSCVRSRFLYDRASNVECATVRPFMPAAGISCVSELRGYVFPRAVNTAGLNRGERMRLSVSWDAASECSCPDAPTELRELEAEHPVDAPSVTRCALAVRTTLCGRVCATSSEDSDWSCPDCFRRTRSTFACGSLRRRACSSLSRCPLDERRAPSRRRTAWARGARASAAAQAWPLQPVSLCFFECVCAG